MKSPQRPRRSLGWAATAVVALVLTACGTGPVGPGPAARVGSVDISHAKVTELLDAQVRYLEGLDEATSAEAASSLALILGVSEGSFSTVAAADALGAWINFEIIDAHLSSEGIEVTQADLDEARTALEAQVGGAEALAELDEGLVDFSVESAARQTLLTQLAQESVAQDPAEREAQLQALWEQSRAATPLCLSLILSDTEEAAAEVAARLDAGDDFAAVARELSADPVSAAEGGVAGCATAEDAAQAFGEDFSSVTAGEIKGPMIPTGRPEARVFVLVRSLDGPTLEEARPGLEAQLDQMQPDPTTEYLISITAEADVEVDPRYGTWNPTEGRVVPPAEAA